MASTALRAKLGKMIKDYLRGAELRQTELANRLGLSSSAVSQMIHGKIVPNRRQLETICEMLALDRPQAFELYSMLSQIRTGADEERSPFNLLVFSLRCRRGLALRQLSNLSGVPVSHLKMFETCGDAAPTLDEARQIAPILGCTEEALLRSAGMGAVAAPGSGGNPRYSTPAVNEWGDEEFVAEARAFYTPVEERSIPMLSLSDLAEYDGRTPIHEYAADCALRHITSDTLSYENMVGVDLPGKDLSLGLPGSVRLLLAAERPTGFREIDFCLGVSGRYSLQEWKNGKRREFRLAGVRRAGEELRWALPLLELTFRPTRPEHTGREY